MSVTLDALAGHIVILSGHPGSGKTTTAQALASLPGVAKVHLHSDDFWGYIRTGRIEPWLPEAHAQNQMINAIVADVAARYAEAGYLVALDGVVRPWWLPAFARKGLSLHYLVLQTSVEEAVRRCQARGGDSLSDPQVVANLHGQFADLGPFSAHVLGVAGLYASETLARVVAALASDRYRLDSAALLASSA